MTSDSKRDELAMQWVKKDDGSLGHCPDCFKAGYDAAMAEKDEALNELLKAVDTAVWCWSVQKNSKRKGAVDWKSSLDELVEAYYKYELKSSQALATIED